MARRRDLYGLDDTTLLLPDTDEMMGLPGNPTSAATLSPDLKLQVPDIAEMIGGTTLNFDRPVKPKSPSPTAAPQSTQPQTAPDTRTPQYQLNDLNQQIMELQKLIPGFDIKNPAMIEANRQRKAKLAALTATRDQLGRAIIGARESTLTPEQRQTDELARLADLAEVYQRNLPFIQRNIELNRAQVGQLNTAPVPAGYGRSPTDLTQQMNLLQVKGFSDSGVLPPNIVRQRGKTYGGVAAVAPSQPGASEFYQVPSPDDIEAARLNSRRQNQIEGQASVMSALDQTLARLDELRGRVTTDPGDNGGRAVGGSYNVSSGQGAGIGGQQREVWTGQRFVTPQAYESMRRQQVPQPGMPGRIPPLTQEGRINTAQLMHGEVYRTDQGLVQWNAQRGTFVQTPQLASAQDRISQSTLMRVPSLDEIATAAPPASQTQPLAGSGLTTFGFTPKQLQSMTPDMLKNVAAFSKAAAGVNAIRQKIEQDQQLTAAELKKLDAETNKLLAEADKLARNGITDVGTTALINLFNSAQKAYATQDKLADPKVKADLKANIDALANELRKRGVPLPSTVG